MGIADHFEEVFPGLFRWEAFSPEHKVELTSHVVLLRDRLYCFDPIPLHPAAMLELTAKGRPHAIVLTNGNHERAAGEWQQKWQVPVWVPAEAGLANPDYRTLPTGESSWDNHWQLNPLPGGAPGEIAFACAELSLLILGDAIVNLPYRGLEVLPAKYCVNRSLLEGTLERVVARNFQRLCMAHGQPVVQGASEAVRQLLHGRSESGKTAGEQ